MLMPALLVGAPLGAGSRSRHSRVKEAPALEAGDERGLGADHASRGATVGDDLVGQSVQEMERRGPAMGEARRVDAEGRGIEEGGAEAQPGITAADAPGSGVRRVFPVQSSFVHEGIHGAPPSTTIEPPLGPAPLSLSFLEGTPTFQTKRSVAQEILASTAWYFQPFFTYLS